MRAPLVWSLVALGLVLRLFHYARGRVVWHDEAALIVNVLDNAARSVFRSQLVVSRDELVDAMTELFHRTVFGTTSAAS